MARPKLIKKGRIGKHYLGEDDRRAIRRAMDLNGESNPSAGLRSIIRDWKKDRRLL